MTVTEKIKEAISEAELMYDDLINEGLTPEQADIYIEGFIEALEWVLDIVEDTKTYPERR